MVKKFFIPGLLVLTLWISLPSAASADTPITGVAKNERFGDLKFDPITGSTGAPALAPEYRANISGSCNAQGCLLKGFIWSDKIGWVALDGLFIASLFPAGSPVTFTPDLYARISAGNGALSGYAWSEHAGWIQLNNDPRVNTVPGNQTQTNWGVYLDTVGVTPDPVRGYRFRGYAWSQKLGWIKFSKESNDNASEPNFAVYANWIPDITPPELLAGDRKWFDVNTPTGILSWTDFMIDNQSGIDLGNNTLLNLTTDMPLGQCNRAGVVRPLYNQTLNGIDLSLQNIGSVSNPSGFCRYFITGTVCNTAGQCRKILDLTAPAPLPANTSSVTNSYRISFYVRAGDIHRDNSPLAVGYARPGATGAIADGNDSATVSLTLRDRTGINPIVRIVPESAYPGSPGRSVVVTASFQNKMRFDSTTLDLPSNNESPVRLRDVVTTPLMFNAGGPVFFTPVGSPSAVYRMAALSYAPTLGNNQFSFNAIQVDVTTDIAGGPARLDAQTFPSNNTPSPLVFLPAVTATNGSLVSSSAGENQISIGVPARLRYELNNLSSQAMPNIDVDHEFTLTSTGTSSSFLETQKIQLNNSPENAMGWRDPLLDKTRYELMSVGMTDGGGVAVNGSNSVFGNAYLPFGDFAGTQRSYLSTDGAYSIDCRFGIPVPPAFNAQGNCDGARWLIDRSDTSPLFSLGVAASSTASSTPEINFNIEKVVPLAVSGASVAIKPFVSYRMPNQPQFTIYEGTPLLDLSVQDLGVQYTGVGSGKSIYQGSGGVTPFNAIGQIDTQKLTTLMHQNVAALTKNMNACPLPASLSDSSLPTLANPCIKVEPSANGQHNNIIAFYKATPGTPNQILTLDRPTPDDAVHIPDNTRYTIIVSGGGSVYLKNNLTYNNLQSSFGLILLADDSGHGGDLLIDPNPTNLVGAVYAEGSVLSYSASAPNGPYFYGGADSNLLANQLLWHGSIVSKNTIGGAPRKVVPKGKSCGASVSDLNCSQRFDLDFVRRFRVLPNAGNTFVTRIANNGKFSGGGSCTNNFCSPGSLESIVKLVDSDGNTSPDALSTLTTGANASILNPFFIQKDNKRITSFPPPGFSLSSDQQFFREIR